MFIQALKDSNYPRYWIENTDSAVYEAVLQLHPAKANQAQACLNPPSLIKWLIFLDTVSLCVQYIHFHIAVEWKPDVECTIG